MQTSALPKTIRAMAATVAMAILAGCTSLASFEGAPQRAGPDESLDKVDKLYDQTWKNYYDATDKVQKGHLRNRFMEQRVAIMDAKYAAFKQELFSQRVGSNVGVDIATMTLSMAGAAIGDVGTKTGLAALSGGLIGSKASIDKNLYFDKTLPVLMAQMDGLRGEVRKRMLDGMRVDADIYPLMQATSDLEDYFNAGTISGAIAEAMASASIAQKSASEKLAKTVPTAKDLQTLLEKNGVVILSVADTETGTALSKCLEPEGVRNEGNWHAMQEWLKTKPGPAAPAAVSKFLKETKYNDLRKLAISDAALLAQFKNCQFLNK